MINWFPEEVAKRFSGRSRPATRRRTSRVAGHAGEGRAIAVRVSKRDRRHPWEDIRTYLNKQKSEALIGLLLDVAQRDDRLYRSLRLNAERSSGVRSVVAEVRKQLKS